MAAILTNDLQQVLSARNPSQLDVVIEADPGQGDAVEDLLGDLGIETTQVRAGSKSVFEATVSQGQLEQIQQSDAVAVLDHSPTFLPTGATAPIPGRSAGMGREANQTDLDSVIERLGFPQAWEKGDTRGEGVTIGVVDTAIDQSHPAIEDNVVATDRNENAAVHGTWVASAMVADRFETERGVIQGGAPDADLVSSGVLSGGGATVTDIASGVGFCLDNDADVINLSLGGPHSSVLQSIVQEAQREGALVVSSAGNSGPGGRTISCPAHHSATISVGSLSTDGDVAAFSSRGPGRFGNRQKPDVMAFGGGATLEDGSLSITETVLGAAPGGRGAYLLGTSMAAPEVAAMAALRVGHRRNEQ